MVKLIVTFICTVAVIFLLLITTDGGASVIFHEALSPPVIFAIATLIAGLTYGFNTYLDAITKDIPEKFKLENPLALEHAIQRLEDLRVEVIKNAILVVVLVPSSALLNGFSEFLKEETYAPNWLIWLIYSVRGGCIAVSLFATIIQFQGFLSAVKFRSIIAKNK